MNEKEAENLKGLAWGNANLRLQNTPFKTVGRDDFGQFVKDFSVFLVWAVEKLNYDPLAARQLFTEKRQQTLDRFFAEELQKLKGFKQLETDSLAVSISIIRKELVPFIGDLQMKWDQRVKDEITGESSPSVLDMLLESCPVIVRTDSIINPTAYGQMLRTVYGDFEFNFRFERTLSYEQDKMQHVERFVPIVIKLKATMTPSP